MLGTVFIGRYKVTEELGRGGMGIVYKGVDPALDRAVAIKVLPPKKLSQKKAIQRFLREARVSARLDHPHIIKIYDIGEEEGIYHIVMEYVSGKTLRDIIEEREKINEINITSMTKLFRQICQAIDYAHNLKIVHRDIKPENIMVTSDGNAKVMDFGLAVLEDRHSITEVGAVMGTIAYFSPEQAKGELADYRSDIYSLGIIFYEMLTNFLPFEATNPSDMIQKHLNAIPQPPSRKNPDITTNLDDIILRALRKNPEERFLNIQEMIRELEKPYEKGAKQVQIAAPDKKQINQLRDMIREEDRKPDKEAAGLRNDKPVDGKGGGAADGIHAEKPDSRKIEDGFNTTGEEPDQNAKPEFIWPLPMSEQKFGNYVPPKELERLSGVFKDDEDSYESGARISSDNLLPSNLVPPEEVDASPEDMHAPNNEYPHSSSQKPHSQYPYNIKNLPSHSQQPHSKQHQPHLHHPLQTPQRPLNPPPSQIKPKDPKAEMPVSFQPLTGSKPIASPQWLMEAKEEVEQDRYQQFIDKLKRDAVMKENATMTESFLLQPSVVCGKCGLENTPDKKYCTECGSLLAPSSIIASKEAAYHNNEGLLYFEDGDYGRALFEFQQAIARDPEMLEARFNIARVYLELGEFARAQDEFRAVSDLQPNNTEPYVYIAEIYRKQDRKDLAINEYLKAIKIDPNDSSIRSQLAFLYSQQGALPQAINEYRAALSIDMNNLEAHRQLGFLFSGLEQIDDAIKEFEWVVRLDPGNHQAHKWLGSLYSKRKRYSHAEKAYTMALSIDPADATTHAQLGSLYEKQNKEEMAFQTLFRAVSIDQGNIEARTKLAEMYQKHNQPHQAVRELEAVISHHPNDIVIHQQLGELYLTINRFDEALHHFEKTVTLAPGNAELHNKLGRLYLKKDDSNLSISEYQKAVEIEPYNPEYREDLGMAYYAQNRNDLAIVELKKAVTLDSRNVDYFKALGIMLEEENRLEEALQMLKKALEMDPDDPIAHGLLGKVYFQKGLANMAIYEYQKGLELQPTNYLFYIYLARAYSKQEKVDQAIYAFRKAIDLMPGAKGLEYNRIMSKAYLDLGKAYIEKGDTTLAKEVLETAYKLTPSDAKITHYLGLIYMSSKDYRKSLELITQALNLEPNNANITADLGKLYSLKGDTDLSIKAYRRAISLAPDRFENYEILTMMLAKSGRFGEAVEILRQVLEIDAKNADHYHWLIGGLLLKQKDPQKAMDEFFMAISINNKNWNYYFDLASAYKNLNRLEEAYLQYEYAYNLCKDKKSQAMILSEMKKLKTR